MKRLVPSFTFLFLAILVSSILSAQVEMNFEFDTPYGQNEAVGKFIEVNGIQMYYEVYGEGEPLLLIHGNGADINSMGNQIDHFKGSYQVIIADSRGHGKSGLGTDSLTYVQMAHDWAAFSKALELGPAHVIGWSDGGIIGLLLGIHHPETVDKIVAMGANLRPDSTAVHSWALESLKGVMAQIEMMIEAGDKSQDWGLIRQKMNLLTQQPNISHEELNTIQSQVLVVAGDQDIIREEHTVEIFQQLPHAHLCIMPGETHYTPASNPAYFNQIVEKFLTEPFKRPDSDWTKE